MSTRRLTIRTFLILICLALATGTSLTLSAQEMAAPAGEPMPVAAEAAPPTFNATAPAEGAAAEAPAAEASATAAPTPEAPAATPTPAAPAPKPVPQARIDVSGRERAIWVDTLGGTYDTPSASQRIVRDLRGAGFNTVYLVVVRGGGAMYPSKHLPPSPAFREDAGDPVQVFIDTALEGENPLKVVLVALPLEGFVGRDLAAAPPASILAKRPDWVLVSEAGITAQTGNLYTLDPALDQVHSFAEAVVRELATRYPKASGIQLHEMRYPGILSDWGYSPAVLKAFAEESGEAERPSPDDSVWQKWRRDRLTALVKRCGNAMRDVRPEWVFSTTAATDGVAPESETEWADSAVYAGALQDWVRWGNEQITDEIVLLNFKSEQFDIGAFDSWNSFAMLNSGGVPVIVALGKAENFAEEVMGQIRRALRTSAKGVAMFSYQEPNIEDIRDDLFKTLGRSVFKADYDGLRRSNITVDPEFAGRVGVAPVGVVRSRSDFTLPAEFLQPIEGSEKAPEAGEAPVAEATPAAAPSSETPATASLLPDLIYMTSGTELRGRIVSESAATITFRNEAGFELIIDRTQVREVRRAQR